MSGEDHSDTRDPWAGRPDLPELPEGWSLVRPEGDLLRDAELVEYEVFQESGLCSESPRGRVEEFEPWNDISDFGAVLSPEGEIQGVVRLMFGRFDDLQVGQFGRFRPWPPDPVLEYGSVAVRRQARKTGTAAWLYRFVAHEAFRLGANGLVAVTEQWTMDLINSSFPMGMEKIGPSKWYMGGECFPMGATLEGILERSTVWPGWFHWSAGTIDLRSVADEEIRDIVIDLRETMAEDR